MMVAGLERTIAGVAAQAQLQAPGWLARAPAVG